MANKDELEKERKEDPTVAVKTVVKVPTEMLSR